MKLCKPSFEILSQEKGLSGINKMIEIAGRTCYKSEGNITEDSSIKFVQMLIDREHRAMLEHGTIYLKITAGSPISDIKYMMNTISAMNYVKNKYSVVNERTEDHLHMDYYISTNYRVLIENDWLEDLQYQCEPTEYHERRVTVKFTTQIAISREFNRHRVDSIAESSTRYCNYSKDKFGNEITINIPSWIKESEVNTDYDLIEKEASSYPCILDKEGLPNGFSQVIYERDVYYWEAFDWWLWANKCAELAYMNLIRLGWTAQQARTILPLDTNTELIHTAFVSDWKHFFSLRCVEAAHIDARELAIPLEKEFKNLKLI